MRRWIALTLARPRFAATALGAIALIALALAGIGVYGVMAALVSQRTHEIGIRRALGAQAADLHRLVLGRGLAVAAMGVLAGLAIALPASRLLGGLLYEVSPADPPTLAMASIALVGLAALACYVPARMAARIDPWIVLRSE
jgi:putative ABC transport system permease protein